jgi:hypothetical protein
MIVVVLLSEGDAISFFADGGDDTAEDSSSSVPSNADLEEDNVPPDWGTMEMSGDEEKNEDHVDKKQSRRRTRTSIIIISRMIMIMIMIMMSHQGLAGSERGGGS